MTPVAGGGRACPAAPPDPAARPRGGGPLPGHGRSCRRCRLGGACLRGGHAEVHRHADADDGRGQQVGVGVGEDPQAPATRPQRLQCRGYLGKRRPRRQRLRQRLPLVVGEPQPRLGGHPGQGLAEHLPVADRSTALHLRLDPVVGGQQRSAVRVRPQPRERAADAALPVDQRPVAVECRPSLCHLCQLPLAGGRGPVAPPRYPRASHATRGTEEQPRRASVGQACLPVIPPPPTPRHSRSDGRGTAAPRPARRRRPPWSRTGRAGSAPGHRRGGCGRARTRPRRCGGPR